MPTVLVVDDTSVDRRLAGGLLEKNAGVEVRYAENGQQAIDEIGRELPDMVLTDLQMPEVDGLGLVTHVADNHPEIPVVLMTAHGSESIAAQALANGAASYVPKSDLAQNLVETVSHILAMSEADSRYRKLIECSVRTEFEFELANDPQIIGPLVDLTHQMMFSMRVLDPSTRVRVGVALEQAVYNSMVRGNLEIPRDDHGVSDRQQIADRLADNRFEDRKVRLKFLVDRDKVLFDIQDQGNGFDIGLVPDRGNPKSLEGSGRGLVLMTNFMDSVEFSDGGKRVTMIKKI